jgi:hypothetical protein
VGDHPGRDWDEARRFECEAEGSNIREMVFNEPWSACHWLGVDRDAALSILRDLREDLRT